MSAWGRGSGRLLGSAGSERLGPRRWLRWLLWVRDGCQRCDSCNGPIYRGDTLKLKTKWLRDGGWLADTSVRWHVGCLEPYTADEYLREFE